MKDIGMAGNSRVRRRSARAGSPCHVFVAALLGSFPLLAGAADVAATKPAVELSPPEAVRSTDPKSPQDALRVLHVKDGYEVELVVSEPLIESPVDIDWG